MGLLKCTKCHGEKPENPEFFPPNKKKKNGLDSWCRKCRSVYRSETNRGKFRDTISDAGLLTLKAEVKECVICGSEERLVVDHDHKTNEVRGLLCQRCNLGLGHFRDDPQLMEFAAQYIRVSSGAKEGVWQELMT